jgi:hypothetical protein
MCPSAPDFPMLQRCPLRPALSSQLLARIALLALLVQIAPCSAQQTTQLPQMLAASPFSHRVEAEANVIAVICRLLLTDRASARRLVAVVNSDISGTLEFSLHQLCAFRRRDVPEKIAWTASFASRTAWRVSLMLKRLFPSDHAVRTEQQTTVRVGGCCQPFSDLDELSFPASCSECSAEMATVR